MGISRAAQSPTLVHRSFKVARLLSRDVIQVRTLWWWGKRSRGWLSSEHDDMDERLRRHQALMMHRYSKAMRRRSLWERDDSPRSPIWRRRGCDWGRDMSSTKPQSAKVEERDARDRSTRQTLQEFHKDFESFKRAVDKAIERDPYGTLFGRRLRSPETSNNSSWTSWSWIFDPKEIKEEPDPKSQQAEKQPGDPELQKTAATSKESVHAGTVAQHSGPSVVHSSSSSKTATSISSSHSVVFQYPASASTEYVYDPISGRKVPKTTSPAPPPSPSKQHPETEWKAGPSVKDIPAVAQTSSQAPQSQLQSSLAPEQGPSQQKTSAPVKSFVQSMFAEHGVDIPVRTYKPPKVYGYTGEPKPTAPEKSPKEQFESTRKREYNQLRLRTLGNNIDATNFNCEPWNNKEPEPLKTEEPSEPAEKRVRTSPAPKEDAPLFSGTTYESRSDELSTPNGDWLAKEGFGANQGLTIPPLKEGSAVPAQRAPVARMEPALDRANTSATEIPVKKFASKLQPAMDRIVPPAKPEPRPTKAIPMQAPAPKKDLPIVEETREDIDLLRASDVRAAAKGARVTKQEVEDKKKQDRGVLEKDFEARQQPGQDPAIVFARPFSSISSSGSMNMIVKHIKHYPDGVVAKTLRNIGITVKPSKEDVQGSVPVKPVSEPDTADQTIHENKSHLKRLTSDPDKRGDTQKSKAEVSRSASNATIEALDAEARQLQRLASDLNTIYRQSIPAEELKTRLRLIQKRAEAVKPPKFSEPTVKPGVVRDLAIERHTQDFEPKIANIVEKAKSVKRELHDVRLGLENVVSERAINGLANRDLIQSKATPVVPIARDVGLEEQSPKAAVTASKPVSASKPLDSPFILLVYNKTIGDVEVTPLNNLIGHASAPEIKTSPVSAIGSLNNPNPFVKHFVDLEKNGYELTSGGGDVLVFKKRAIKPVVEAQRETPTFTSSLPSTSELRSTIAAAEAAAQPQPQTRNAAKVLDEMPSTIPAPGPAAPTAPSSSQPPPTRPETSTSSSTAAGIPLSSTSGPEQSISPSTPTSSQTEPQPAQPTSARRPDSRINRQEQVFSGQVRLQPQTTGLPDPEHFQKQNPAATVTPDSTAYSYTSSQHETPYSSSEQQRSGSNPGLFARLRRTIRRVILTALALGVSAYGIGVLAEGINAKAQVEASGVGGPMRRIVMEDSTKREGERQRERAGIFSTESSR